MNFLQSSDSYPTYSEIIAQSSPKSLMFLSFNDIGLALNSAIGRYEKEKCPSISRPRQETTAGVVVAENENRQQVK